MIASLQFSLPPSLSPLSRQAQGLGLGRISLNPCLSLPTIPPCTRLAFLPSHLSPCCSLRTVCSNPAAARRCWQRLLVGIRHPQCEHILLRGVFGVGSLSRTPKPFPLHPKQCGCAGGGSSADGEELEQGCSFQINWCYLCNSKRMGGGEEEKKREKMKIKRKSFSISQLHKAAFALTEPLPCPHVLRQGTVLWECVCVYIWIWAGVEDGEGVSHFPGG